jgi:hypothetical protein
MTVIDRPVREIHNLKEADSFRENQAVISCFSSLILLSVPYFFRSQFITLM